MQESRQWILRRRGFWSRKVRLLSPGPSHIARILSDAIAYRDDLLQRQDACVRVVAGAADDGPGLIVDRFGRLVVCSDYNPAGQGEALIAALEAAFPGRSILLRWRGKEGDQALRLRWGGIPAPEQILAVDDPAMWDYCTQADRQTLCSRISCWSVTSRCSRALAQRWTS